MIGSDNLPNYKNTNMDCFEFQELDRKRISSELHDTSLQDLTHMIHQLELCSLYIDVDPIKAKLELEDVSNQLRKVIQDIRNTIFDLRPMSFDDLGLEESIDQYISFINKKYNINFITYIDDVNYLDEKKKLAVYRIIQECLMNCAKHSEAESIKLKLKDNESEIIIIIEDDGIGIDQKKCSEGYNTHYGLSIIRDRVNYLNGTYVITSDDKCNGTCIEIKIPNKKGVVYEN